MARRPTTVSLLARRLTAVTCAVFSAIALSAAFGKPALGGGGLGTANPTCLPGTGQGSEVKIIKGPATRTDSRSATFRFGIVSCATGEFTPGWTCSLDGTLCQSLPGGKGRCEPIAGGCPSPLTLKRLKPGRHVFTVASESQSTSSTATHTWTITK